MTEIKKRKLVDVGWREWISLPELGIERIKAKVDTGARTSALHAFRVETYSKDTKDFVKFWIHPFQRDNETVKTCHAEVLEKRSVTDSGGHTERRFVIRTILRIPEDEWQIEITLTDRESMQFRMLLGRTAMRGHMLVHPGKSYMLGRYNKE